MFQELHTLAGVPANACSGRVRMAEHPVKSRFLDFIKRNTRLRVAIPRFSRNDKEKSVSPFRHHNIPSGGSHSSVRSGPAFDPDLCRLVALASLSRLARPSFYHSACANLNGTSAGLLHPNHACRHARGT